MNIFEAMKTRHSVRNYLDKSIEEDTIQVLQQEIDKCNQEGNLNIQLCINEPNAFDSMMARYGKFKNVKNYIALVGGKGCEEKLGYYGERIILFAQSLGLNTCWVGLSYSKGKSKVIIGPKEKLHLVISLGYGSETGNPHKTKTIEELSSVDEKMPDWFKKGMEAVQLAPTAMNQQKFHFTLQNGEVITKTRRGFYTKIDLGIAKYHFEMGSGLKL